MCFWVQALMLCINTDIFFSFTFLCMCCAQQFNHIPDINKTIFFSFFLLFDLRVYLFHMLIMLIEASTVSSHAQCAQNWFSSRNIAVRMSHSYRIIYTTWQQFNKLLASNSCTSSLVIWCFFWFICKTVNMHPVSLSFISPIM